MVRPLRKTFAVFASLATLLMLSSAALEAQTAPTRQLSGAGLEGVLGKEVTNLEGDGGRVIDLLADSDGNLRAVVIEFGGFLGIGTRKIAVEWAALQFNRAGGASSIVANVTRDQVRATPEYKSNEPAVVAKAFSAPR